MNQYEHNLVRFKELIDKYTIADLKTMIYSVSVSESGACCYPAIQTLISVMEMLGRICRHDLKEEESFGFILSKLGQQYNDPEVKTRLYKMFRHGIAHSSLAKGGVFINKRGDSNFHLANNKNYFDIRIMFEDFIKAYDDLFNKELLDPQKQTYYEENLKQVLKSLNLPWLDLSTPSFMPQYVTTTSGNLSGPSGCTGPITFTP